MGLYGFSAGANTAHSLLGEKGIRDKVDQVVTVAPFHGSQTQNFKGTNWDNYPDYSSRGIAPQGRGFEIQTRQHTKEAQREAATGLGRPTAAPQAPVQFGIIPRRNAAGRATAGHATCRRKIWHLGRRPIFRPYPVQAPAPL